MSVVVTLDNSSGYREWASAPQPSREAALTAAQIAEDQLGSATVFGYQVEEVATVPDLSQWEGDHQFDQGGNYIA
jgi:hypothetical protein